MNKQMQRRLLQLKMVQVCPFWRIWVARKVGTEPVGKYYCKCAYAWSIHILTFQVVVVNLVWCNSTCLEVYVNTTGAVVNVVIINTHGVYVTHGVSNIYTSLHFVQNAL